MNQIGIRAFQKIIFSTLGLFLISGSALYSLDPKGVSAATAIPEQTLQLYDSASGMIPSAPLMSFIDVPSGVALPAYSDGVTVMDTTTADKDTYAGWISSGATIPGFPVLDRMVGFQVNFTFQLENESHANNDRAGLSVIVLGEDARGVELAFWQDEIWVQNDDNTGGLFTHGEGVAFATTTGLIDYQITILEDTYTLTADTKPILTGPVRDYSQFDGFPDPYETPNFLFLGDDTTSAEVRVQLSLVSITRIEPIIPTAVSSPSPLPTDSPAPLPSVTPLPSPTPETNVFDPCPSSGLLVLLSVGMVIKKNFRQAIPPHDFEEK